MTAVRQQQVQQHGRSYAGTCLQTASNAMAHCRTTHIDPGTSSYFSASHLLLTLRANSLIFFPDVAVIFHRYLQYHPYLHICVTASPAYLFIAPAGLLLQGARVAEGSARAHVLGGTFSAALRMPCLCHAHGSARALLASLRRPRRPQRPTGSASRCRSALRGSSMKPSPLLPRVTAAAVRFLLALRASMSCNRRPPRPTARAVSCRRARQGWSTRRSVPAGCMTAFAPR